MSGNSDAMVTAMDSGFDKEGARLYDRYTRVLRNEKERAFWRQMLTEAGGETVLDVGAGTGFISEIALELGFRVTALDRSPSMLEKASNNLKARYGDHFTTVVGNAEDIPFPDAGFDLVMTRAALWTLPHPTRMLDHARRVLKPDGTFLLSDGTFKHMNTPVVWFSSVCHTILDFLIGQRLPRFSKGVSMAGDGLPFLPQEKVVEELRAMDVKILRSYDLVPYQDLIYRMIGLYWYPYLLYVKF